MDKVTVWFDGGCPLCRREIALMRRLDKRRAIDFVDVSGSSANCPLFHARENGKIVSGAAAFAAMWRVIPLLRPLAMIADTRVGLALMERAYLFFLVHRPKLQRFFREREAT
jgi:predicted DCC family thiol-disulfide oxidoreductase YuxK